ncbi:hypothetical protein VTO42DRAFT_7671 [Malbranchea cinnamomea]
MPGLSGSVARSWSSTLKLPKSTFPARVGLTDQAKYLQRCTDDLYTWQRRARPENSSFVLHDGPPYANGELHIGHALNKILKDIICRLQLAKGKRVTYVPGWDCHGLPIELKALQAQKELGQQRYAGNAGAAVIRKAARELAEKTVSDQRDGFRKWAVMADWEAAWKTMDRSFVMRQLGVFLDMVDKGLIFRRFKPVYWSPSTGTALAEAELEYRNDHVSTAALVKFPLVAVPTQLQAHFTPGCDEICAVIWTTTPWTLPANAAIAVHSDLEYRVVKSQKHGKLLIASSRQKFLEEMLEDEFDVVVPSISGSELQSNASYRPLFKGPDAQPRSILAADFVTDDSGSGLVHCAPGHGMEDYEVCLANGIPVFAPVDEDGLFTDAAMPSDPEKLKGKSVLDEGNQAVLDLVAGEGRLLHKHAYKHKYPYDWRSKLPVIIRATEQWFADVGDIRDDAVRALQEVRFIPPSGKSRLEAFVKNRSEWCISRQRAWGVPIPALYNRETGEAVLTRESVSHIMKVIEDRGVDAWWTDDENDPAWTPPSLRVPNGPGYRRGIDTMDVWFDSGTSWTQLTSRAQTDSDEADVYLEGSDQHRGWFQSSLLTYVAHQLAKSPGTAFKAPFRTLITHGFTLDQESRKMSKSIGNVVSPDEIMNGTLLPPIKPRKVKGAPKPTGPVHDALGPDALRLWVASSDYTKDVMVGEQVLKSVHTALHKYRVTFKLLLGALQDFSPSDQVPYESLQKIDKIALLQLRNLIITCQSAFEEYEFFKAVTAINRWANLEFSAFYLECIKDRLYTESPRGLSRRAAQTTLFHIYTHFQNVLGPIVPLLVEESWEHTPEMIKSACEHPLKRVMTVPSSTWEDDMLEKAFPTLMAANAAIKQMQETARSKKQMGSSLQSYVHLVVPEDVTVFEYFGSELPDLFVVSSVTLGSSVEPLPAEVQKAAWSYDSEFELPGGRKGRAWIYTPQAGKCPRCWRYVAPLENPEEERLCQRCEDVVKELDASSGNEEAGVDSAASGTS